MSDEGSKKDIKTICLPTIELDSGSYFLLSVLNKKWTFRAERFGKKHPKSHENIHGKKLDTIKGTGSVKCKPNKDNCLDFKFRVTQFPISEIGSDKYILLSKKRFEDSKMIDSWTFIAEKIDDSRTKKNRPHDPNGHEIGEAIGEKIVGVMPKKFNVNDF